jgi:transposase-like protein
MDTIEENSTKSAIFRYSKEFKNRICQEYLNGKESKRFLEKKYKLGNSRLLYWMQELGYIASKPIKVSMSKDQKLSEELSPEQKRIKELEKELENARLQAEAYRLMIEVAERELQIKIRKK